MLIWHQILHCSAYGFNMWRTFKALPGGVTEVSLKIVSWLCKKVRVRVQKELLLQLFPRSRLWISLEATPTMVAT